MRAARALWGAEVVARALADAAPDAATPELGAAIRDHMDPPGAFRAWSLARPWPEFCAIVRVVSGQLRREVMQHGEG